MSKQRYDIAIIGAGIVGLTTAIELLTRFSSLQLAVLAKEQPIGQYQTGRNSGVLHLGVYYAPGSRKRERLRGWESQAPQLLRRTWHSV